MRCTASSTVKKMDSIASWAVLSIAGLAAVAWLLLNLSREERRTMRPVAGTILTQSPIRSCLREIESIPEETPTMKRRRAQAVGTPELFQKTMRQGEYTT